jgi:hypothetical protein
MPLAISDFRFFTGVPGRAGTPGADAPNGGTPGEGGSNGRGGQAAVLTRTAQTLTGDAGNDSVVINSSATGGRGGAGGQGGDGRAATLVTTFQSTANSNSTFNNFGANTDGGFGGRGGAGGRGDVVLSSLVFDLASVPGGADVLSFFGTAVGGAGERGGLGGGGGASGGTAFSQRQIGVPGNYFTEYSTTASTPTGQSGGGGISGAGGRGLVAFDALSVSAGALTMRIDGLAVGGEAADGVNATGHPQGAQPADALSGGAGRTGGFATARVDDLTLTAGVRLDLRVMLEARGGLGGDGGLGAVASSTTDSNLNLTNGVGTFTVVTTYAATGNGGNGGAGGTAFATFTDGAIRGSATADIVDIRLVATGGTGGRRGDGNGGFADSITVSGSPATIIETRRIDGTPDGNDGVAGIGGRSVVTMTGNVITLGDGADRLELLFAAQGPGARVIDVDANRFEGEGGNDTLRIGDAFTVGQPAVSINLNNGVMRIGAGINTVQGFERIETGAGNDSFIDTRGDQVYRGNGGADRYSFVSGRAGNDRIELWTTDDVVVLSGFGPALDEFPEVLAAATQRADGVLLRTGATSTVLLEGALIANLGADDFAF